MLTVITFDGHNYKNNIMGLALISIQNIYNNKIQLELFNDIYPKC